MQNPASFTHLRRSATCGKGVLHNATGSKRLMQNPASLTHLRRSGTCGKGVLHNAPSMLIQVDFHLEGVSTRLAVAGISQQSDQSEF